MAHLAGVSSRTASNRDRNRALCRIFPLMRIPEVRYALFSDYLPHIIQNPKGAEGSHIHPCSLHLSNTLGKEKEKHPCLAAMPLKSGYHSLSSDSHDSDSDSDLSNAAAQEQQPNGLAKSPWTLIPTTLALVCLLTWIPLVLFAWKATTELALARQLLVPPPPQQQQDVGYTFIPGGYAKVPGYGLVFNHTYCDGIRDPEGAKQRGCVFDPGQGGWIHRACQDPEVLEWWMSLPEWEVRLPIPPPQIEPSMFCYLPDLGIIWCRAMAD
jgi:hypothetical protein